MSKTWRCVKTVQKLEGCRESNEEFTGRDWKADKLVRKQSDLGDVIKKKRKRNEIENSLVNGNYMDSLLTQRYW